MPHHKDARLSFYGQTAVFHFHIDNVAQLSALAANSLCCISCCPKLTISLILLSVSLLIVNVIFFKKILIRIIIKIYIFLLQVVAHRLQTLSATICTVIVSSITLQATCRIV